MKCEQCGKEFENNYRAPHQRFCSKKCRDNWWWAHREENPKSSPPPDERVCVICGKTFYSRHNTQKCCSKPCSAENEERRRKDYFYRQFSAKIKSTIEPEEPPQKCRHCGKEFIPTRQGQVYCDAKCYDADRRRLKKSEHKSQINEMARQAKECNLDYGTYRGLIAAGKAFDELKAQAATRNPQVHQRTPQRLRGN